MDEFDRASELETRERETAIAARSRPNTHGNGICIDCLEPVEPQRHTALRCISCQQDEDHRHRALYGVRHV